MDGVAIETVFVDVGGTLWPNIWPVTPEIHRRRARAVERVLGKPGTGAPVLAAIVEQIDEGRAAASDEPIDTVVERVLVDHGLDANAWLARRVRQALCVDLGPLVAPFPHAAELLEGIADLGCRCVILSNTTFRDSEVYGRDFRALGWSRWIDGCVTSVDVGVSKPDRRIFTAALRRTASSADGCVMVGDSEDADIVPAVRLGLRTILVAIEHPAPATTSAHGCVTDLRQVLDILRKWQARPSA